MYYRKLNTDNSDQFKAIYLWTNHMNKILGWTYKIVA